MKQLIYTITLSGGHTEIIVTQSNTGSNVPYLNLIRVHGDEGDAKEVGHWWLENNAGQFIDVNNTERKVYFYRDKQKILFDPNRIFSELGIIADLTENNFPTDFNTIHEIKIYAEALLKPFDQAEHIIVLHNNLDFKIQLYQVSGECERAALDLHVNANLHPHNLILVTEKTDFIALKQRNLNVVLLRLEVEDYTGSLSAYCLENTIRYFNIETHFGEVEQQKFLLGQVAEIIY